MLLLSTALVVSCASSGSPEPEAPPAPPPGSLVWDARPGPVLGQGEAEPPAMGTPYAAARLELAWRSDAAAADAESPPLPEVPSGQPLDLAARLILTPGESDPWSAVSRRAAEVRYVADLPSGAPGALGESVDVLQLACPAGATAEVRVESDAAQGPIELRLGARPDGGHEVVCALRAPDGTWEELLLDAPLAVDGPTTAFAFRADGDPPGTWWITLSAIGFDALRDPESMRSAAQERLSLHAQPTSGPDAATSDSEREARIASAVLATENEASRRSALVYLTEACDASLAGDLALVAADDDLDSLLQDWRERLGTERSPEAIGLSLERAAARFASKALSGEDPPIELRSLLLVHTGELARAPGAVVALADAATSIDQLKAAIVEENLAALTDGDPAVRVAAFEWLARREAQPVGYEPLAGRDERRRALENFAEARAAAAAAPPEPAGGSIDSEATDG